MNSKKCFKCGEIKLLAEFYAHPQMVDGYLNKCKECNKKDVRENYRANRHHYVEYERKRNLYTHRIEQNRAFKHQYRQNNPEKRAAHIAVGNAVRDGRLIKQPCEVCGNHDVHGHHDDYSKPLVVRWLCPFHHSQHHANERKMAVK